MSNKYGLTEDQLSIQEMAKKFADEVVAETVTDLDAWKKYRLPLLTLRKKPYREKKL